MKRVLSVFFDCINWCDRWGGSISIGKQFSDTFAQVVEKVNPAVVTITSEKIIKWEDRRFRHPFEEYFGEDFFKDYFDLPEGESRNRVLGSGVIVDAGKGYILTNNHVVENMDEITVKLIDKREFEAEVVGTDPKSDLAIIQIEAFDLIAVDLGDSDKLRVGEWVLAIGSPFTENLSHTVTAGIVSALGRSNIISGDNYEDFIQTDSAINPGNSGGALVNLDGALIGINTAIATGGFERSNRGVGFAIPVNMARKVMDDLINEGRVIRSWLGVYIQDLDDATARAMSVRTAIDSVGTAGNAERVLAISPTSYNLGISRGYQSFAQTAKPATVSVGLRDMGMPDLANFRARQRRQAGKTRAVRFAARAREAGQCRPCTAHARRHGQPERRSQHLLPCGRQSQRDRRRAPVQGQQPPRAADRRGRRRPGRLRRHPRQLLGSAPSGKYVCTRPRARTKRLARSAPLA